MSNVKDDHRLDLHTLARELRQRLESLRRAGIDRMPRPPVMQAVARAETVRVAIPAPRPEPEAPAAKAALPVQEPPSQPRPTVAPNPLMPAASLFGDQEMESPV